MANRISIPFLVSVSLFVLLSGALFFYLTFPGEKEAETYHTLISKARIAGTKQKSSPYTAQQEREGVRKDFSFEGERAPLEGRLFADTSVVVFDRGETGSEAIEFMTGVTGMVQEEVRDSEQIIRTFKALNAEYHYKTEELHATGVLMERYKVAGEKLTDAPSSGKHLLSGQAGTFSCMLNGKGSIQLRDPVYLRFQEGGELTCTHGEIDCLQGTGSVVGNPVVYSEEIETVKHQTGDQLILTSPRMCFTFSSDIDTAVAEGQVSVTYGTTFQAIADTGSYCREEQDSAVVTLKAVGNPGTCSITDQLGGRIDGQEVRLFPLFHSLECDEPVGHLATPTSVDFSARSLFWNGNFHTLILHEEVVVQQEGFGQVETDNELILVREAHSGKGGITKMLAHGHTVLSHCPNGETFSQTLICPGTLCIDHEKGVALLESADPADGEQVTYLDQMGKIFADSGEIIYRLEEGQFIPSKIHLTGNVRLLNHLPGAIDVVSQYVVADDMVYHPGTQEMLLTSYADNRVLLYDKGNRLEVSAPSLTLSRDHLTKRETLEGKGDVRFRFVEHELEQIRKSFLLIKEGTS